MFGSCNFLRGTSSYEENDSVMISKAQRDSIIQSREYYAGLNMDLQEELYNILWEMDEIAGETFELERQREREGGIEDRVAVRIQKRIAFSLSEKRFPSGSSGSSCIWISISPGQTTRSCASIT